MLKFQAAAIAWCGYWELNWGSTRTVWCVLNKPTPIHTPFRHLKFRCYFRNSFTPLVLSVWVCCRVISVKQGPATRVCIPEENWLTLPQEPRAGLCRPLSYSCWNFCWTDCVWVLCIQKRLLCVFYEQPCHVWKTLFCSNPPTTSS